MVGVVPVGACGAEAAATESVARNIALFLAAPFIGLAYIIAFPVVGFWMIARCGVLALLRTRGA
jgi:hypothetical protein